MINNSVQIATVLASFARDPNFPQLANLLISPVSIIRPILFTG